MGIPNNMGAVSTPSSSGKGETNILTRHIGLGLTLSIPRPVLHLSSTAAGLLSYLQEPNVQLKVSCCPSQLL